MNEYAVVRSARTKYLWGIGVVGGLVAGVGMGLVMHFWIGVMPVIGAVYGFPNAVAGWVAHLFHSVLFGLVFVAGIRFTPLHRQIESFPDAVGVGLLYGAMLELVMLGIALPAMVAAVDPEFSGALVTETGAGNLFEFGMFLGAAHLVYGTLLGAAYGVITPRVPTPDPENRSGAVADPRE